VDISIWRGDLAWWIWEGNIICLSILSCSFSKSSFISSLTILQCHICSILAPNLQPRFPFQDQNRYNAGRGAHINLKRAEKARTLVSKLPCKLYTCSYFYWKISKSLKAPYILNNFRRTFQKAAVSYMIIIWGCLDNRYSNLRLQTMYWLGLFASTSSDCVASCGCTTKVTFLRTGHIL
jgi:hypothetical protein